MLAADVLGRSGAAEAVDPLRRLISSQLRNPDVLWAAIPALGRLAAVDDRPSLALLRKLYTSLTQNTDAFPVAAPAWTVDVPDRLTRAEAIAQLALCAMARIGDTTASDELLKMIVGANNPADAEVVRLQAEVDKLRQEMTDASTRMRAAPPAQQPALQQQFQQISQAYQAAYNKLRAAGGGNLFASRQRGVALKNLAPPARFIACEALALAGAAGHQHLLAVVEDTTEYTALRLHAFDRLDLAVALGDPGLVAKRLARIALGHTGVPPAPPPQPNPRIPPIKRPGADEGPAEALGKTVPPEVSTRALASLARLDPATARETAAQIVGGFLMLPEPVAPPPPDPARPVVQTAQTALPSQDHWIVIPALQLLGRAGANTLARIERIIARAEAEIALAELLTERQRQANAATTNMYSTINNRVYSLPELLEVALLELGRMPEAHRTQAYALLAARLADVKARGRYQAVIALGGIQTRAAVERLVAALEDEEGWVRYGAYRALRQLSGADHACDWLYGKPSSHQEAIKAYRAYAATVK
jgi:HEAT repeat protein